MNQAKIEGDKLIEVFMVTVNNIRFIAVQCAIILVQSHIYSENDSPFPDMNSWVRNQLYWNDILQYLQSL